MSGSWDEGVVAWWVDEVRSDPVYRDEVVPLLIQVLDPAPGRTYLDLGCGEGGVMEAVAGRGAKVLGCDLSESLARRASRVGPVAVCRLPDLGWACDAAVDGAYAVLVLEHIGDCASFFRAAARVVRPGGVLALVANHPTFTAPASGPFIDVDDGEVLWRWGPYLQEASSEEPAGPGFVVFHHRPMSTLLETAADAGWSLRRMREFGVGEGRAAADPLLGVQANIPRLLAVGWERLIE